MQYGTVDPANCLADECPYVTKPQTNADRIRRLIDADALEKEFCHGCQYENNKYVNCIDCAVANAPTVDAVKVVRCVECKYYQKVYGGLTFGDVGHCICHSFETVPDWYCADGERL